MLINKCDLREYRVECGREEQTYIISMRCFVFVTREPRAVETSLVSMWRSCAENLPKQLDKVMKKKKKGISPMCFCSFRLRSQKLVSLMLALAH